MAQIDDAVLMDPKRIRDLLTAAYAEGRAHATAEYTSRYGYAPKFEESQAKVWADLYDTVRKD